jgi:outer membrane protein OmpA-like peptidoglycan-associated protein
MSWDTLKGSVKQCRRYQGILTVELVFRNDGDDDVSGGSSLKENRINYQDLYVIDAKAKKKYFTLKDKEGGCLAGPQGIPHGKWWPAVRAKSAVPIWAKFPAPPSDVKEIDIYIPGMPPFEDNPIQDGPASFSPDGPVLQTVDTYWQGVSADLVKAKRRGDEVSVELVLKNSTDKAISGGPALDENRISYNDVFLFDTAKLARYGVKKDAEGAYLAGPLEGKDGRWWVKIPARGETKVWMKLLAPPADVQAVDIYVPGILPFENAVLSGEGGGVAAASGSMEAKTSAVDAALKDLGAKVTEEEIVIDLPSDVLFDFDKADLKRDAEGSLTKIAAIIKDKAKGRVTVEGHTDGKGVDAYNQTLSEKRADAVKKWLADKGGIVAARIETKGWGKTKPVAPNENPDGSDNLEGRQKNRRVEIRMKK